MNRPDEAFAARIARELDYGVEHLDPGTRERLAAARKVALSHYRERPAPVFGLVISGWGRLAPHGGRYLVAVAALVLGLAGFGYWQTMTNGNGNDVSDVDVKLLTDDLPINAYLDTGFDSWLKRAPR